MKAVAGNQGTSESVVLWNFLLDKALGPVVEDGSGRGVGIYFLAREVASQVQAPRGRGGQRVRAAYTKFGCGFRRYTLEL